jgi:hypothetical protein
LFHHFVRYLRLFFPAVFNRTAAAGFTFYIFFSNCTAAFHSFLLMYHLFFPMSCNLHIKFIIHLFVPFDHFWENHFCLVLLLGAFRVVAKSAYLLRHVRLFTRLSACISTDPTGRISVKFDIGSVLGKYAEKVQIWLKSGTWYENLSTFYCYWRHLNRHKSLLIE